MTNDSHRKYFIDNLRGVLIILVILGHCIQSSDIDFDHSIIFRYIYAFHMPLFMYISGFVSYKAETKLIQIKRRFLQLVIPFMAWAALDMTLSASFNWNWIVQPDTALWFLWVLFWISVLYISMSIFSNKTNIAEECIYAIGCLALLIIMVINKLSFGFHLIAWYLPFYILGVISRKYENKIFSFLSQTRWIWLGCYLIGAFFWMRNESPTFMQTTSQVVIFGYKFLIGIIGCLCFMSLFILWKERGLIICELGGGMTLGIYAIHQPVIKWILILKEQIGIEVNSLWLQIAILFLITVIFTIFVYYVLTKTKITRILFLGK